jgi:aerobic-type carbon monoxide dehydrogenase small subunit (CoxS/CutS family)
MLTVALLQTNTMPANADIDAVRQENICRLGTHPRIRQAIYAATSTNLNISLADSNNQ